MTVWAFVVLGFLGTGDSQPGVIGQANHSLLGRFILPTSAACEAAREGVREFAGTANQTLLIGRCLEETRLTPVSAERAELGRN